LTAYSRKLLPWILALAIAMLPLRGALSMPGQGADDAKNPAAMADQAAAGSEHCTHAEPGASPADKACCHDDGGRCNGKCAACVQGVSACVAIPPLSAGAANTSFNSSSDCQLPSRNPPPLLRPPAALKS